MSQQSTNSDQAQPGAGDNNSVDGSLPTLGAEVDDESHIGCPIVGVGASAGGLRAFTELLEHLPSETGLCFVLVQHLDPHHPSQLTQLLEKVTPLSVVEASDGMPVLPERIHVIPPNTELTIRDGLLRLTPRASGPTPAFPIDACFASLAADCGSSASGVLLSGGGSDGTLGFAAIKAAGGITFAQEESSADHPSMPQSAITAGSVDFVGVPAAIAAELARIAQHAYLRTPSEVAVEDPAEVEEAFAGIVDRIRSVTKVDFCRYRPTTIRRRILRRMAIDGYTDPSSYLSYLERYPERTASLLKDILINVTGFFRDAAVFAAIRRTAVEQLAEDPGGEHVVRLWVVGCSTGQEVYSLAIELFEAVERQGSQPRIEIFATDVSDEALAVARAGIYPANIEAEVPPERLRRWFTRTTDGYQIVKSIRETCLFARHDVTLDIPFSKIDLLSCRNVLIYMSVPLQERVVATFHYALRPKGLLLLGAAETVGNATALFDVVDQKHQLYRRRGSAAPPLPPTPDLTTGTPGTVKPAHKPDFDPRPATLTELQRTADRIVLARFAPAGVLIDENYEILQFRGDTSPFLDPSQGRASLNLLKMLPQSLGREVADAIDEAGHSGVVVRREHVPLRKNAELHRVHLRVVPVRQPGSSTGAYLVLFELETPNRDVAEGGDSEGERLRRELSEMEDYLQTLVDDAADAQEQRREALEDATSSNEELRCANEELQTTKEELESTNEELLTVNEELRSRNQDLNRSSERIAEAAAFSQAVLRTVRDPLLVLGEGFRIEMANPAFYTLFDTQEEAVIGQPFLRLDDGQWDRPELRRLLEGLLESGRGFDGYELTHEVPEAGIRTMRLHARGLHADGQATTRIVLVIADVTEETRAIRTIKETSSDLARSNAQLERFAQVASHDLQAPLRLTIAYLDLLHRRVGPNLDDEAKGFLERAVSAATRMRDLIKGLLQHAGSGSDSLQLAPLDTAEVWRSVMEDVDLEDPATTITTGSLPTLVADRLLLRQVFQNLLTNAVKYRAPERSPRITLSATRDPDSWTFAFTDNGIGIVPEDTERVFSLFERSNTSSERPGSGIGLATCKQIVERHGGSMWLESEADHGTTIYFTVPERQASTTAPVDGANATGEAPAQPREIEQRE